MARSRTLRFGALAVSNILLPLALLVFAIGFFPYKPLLPGLATFEDTQDGSPWTTEKPEAAFARVVFMVVDALRSDFVYGHNSGFEFTQSLIRSGAAIPFTAHAAPPTVTMPRIKALTTGSVPSFADLIFNLDESGGAGASLAAQDTWLAQIRARGGKVVFYGDDTWLRLFPGDFFERADGTSSFFVSDFYEVDSNVTRHVPKELGKRDWDAMVMHYLGLDHIGHKTGPNGPKMLSKQKEMDAIVKMVYEAMERDEGHARTLLVLAGDHGMSAGGNHGGSGPGETEPALVFVSPRFAEREGRVEYECPTAPREGTEYHFYRKIEQSDLVPILNGLLGLPISKNSLGVFARELASAWPGKQATQISERNARQIKHIVMAAYGAESFEMLVQSCKPCVLTAAGAKEGCACPKAAGDAEELARRWAWAESQLFAAESSSVTGQVDEALLAFMTEAQDILSNAASSYGVKNMAAGILLSGVALMFALLSSAGLWPPTTGGFFFAAILALYAVMMFASSYVEEEQHLWYWLTPAWVTLLTAKSTIGVKSSIGRRQLALCGAIILGAHRIAVRWNQTGQKHAGEPDIVHSIFPEHHRLMWLLVLMTYGYVGVKLAQRTFLDLFSTEIGVAAAVALCLPALVFKLNFTQADAPELVQGLATQIRRLSTPFSLVSQAQMTFALLALAAVVVASMAISLARGTVLAKKDGPAMNVTLAERLHYLLALFLITETRASNIPLFLAMEAQRLALARLLPNTLTMDDMLKARRNAAISSTELATSAVLLSHVYFFCMAGSNSVSSVDLSNAYNGVGDYNVLGVGLLLFVSNWAGPVYWCSAAVTLTFSRASKANLLFMANANGKRSWVEEERTKLKQDAAATPAPDASSQGSDHGLLYVSCMTVFVSGSLVAVMAACTALRTHLFIWTVFSPKYLYAMAWCAGWHLLINIGFGSLLRWLGHIA